MNEVDDIEKEGKLTEKMERFCQEYLVDLNAGGAAIRAGYSENAAYSIGWENLRKPQIQKRLQELREEMSKGFNITKERIISEYAKMAFFDIRKIHTVDGAIMNVKDFDDESAAAVAGIEVYEENLSSDSEDEQIKVGTVKKIKLANKKDALDSLSKILGYAPVGKVSLTDNDGNPVAIPAPVVNVYMNGQETIQKSTPEETDDTKTTDQ